MPLITLAPVFVRLAWCGGWEMPRPERPVDPDKGPAQRFAVALRELRRSAGNPTYRVLAERAHYSTTTLAQAASGEQLPTLAVALAYARACNGDVEEWTD